jgi:hypothetical protein
MTLQESSRTKSRLVRWMPVVVWAVVISIFSTHWFGSDETGHVIVRALHWLLPHTRLHTLNLMHHIIRKMAHVFEYAVFSLLISSALRSGHRNMPTWVLSTIAIGIVFGYACLDEYHQSFVPGRTPAVTAGRLDPASGVLAQSFAALVMQGDDERESRGASSEAA